MINRDPRYQSLVLHHAVCRWPKAELVPYEAQTRGFIPPEFLAQGFDAVIVDEDCPLGGGLYWLKDLSSRPGFAPLIFLTAHDDAELEAEAAASGAHGVVSRAKISHDRLLNLLESAAATQAKARGQRRLLPEGREAQTFGEVRIPHYRRIRRLATGPVSDLYLAESEQAGTLVALKVARDREEAGVLDESFKRFLQEYEIVHRIHHKSIVTLYDLGVSDEHAYLVMEYFASGDLRRRMRAGITQSEALAYATSIARGLAAIHAAGVLHRDLKPGNVMLRDDGTLALIDFGLAKDAALQAEITDRGMIFGTPHYMSPEQGHGEPLDGRSDLYSLGVILYEMLAGVKPYLADNPMAIVYLHRKSPVPRLPEHLSAYQTVVDRLLAKTPAERFGSAVEAEAALQALQPRPLAAAESL